MLGNDIIMLGKSLIKWKQRPDIIIAVDWDVKHQFKQTNILCVTLTQPGTQPTIFTENFNIDTCMRKHGFGNLHIFIPVFAVPIYVFLNS